MKVQFSILALLFSLMYVSCSSKRESSTAPPNKPFSAIQKTRLFADSINHHIGYYDKIAALPDFVNDSIHPHYNILRGDTQTILASGFIAFLERAEYIKHVQREEFGVTEFYVGPNHQARIGYMHLSERRYVIIDDALYELKEIGKQLILNEDLVNGVVKSISTNNTRDCYMSRAEIESRTMIDSVTYYKLHLTGKCGSSRLTQYLIIDEDFRVIEDIYLRKKVNRQIRLQ